MLISLIEYVLLTVIKLIEVIVSWFMFWLSCYI